MLRSGKRNGRRGLMMVAMACAAAAGWRAHASDKIWVNASGGSFTDSANWSGGVPGAADVAVFHTTFGNTFTVNFAANVTNQALRVENDSVTFDLNGRTYTTTLFNANNIGSIGFRGLNVTDGTLAVSVPGNRINIAPTGGGAGGFLNVLNGGQISGSPFINVGLVGTGLMQVQDGINIPTLTLDIGVQSGSTGTLNVTGAGTTLNTGACTVADFGTGTMTISNEARVVSVATNLVGVQAGSSGTVNVSGANSQWSNTGSLTIGNSGRGILNITGGGRVSNTSGTVAANGSSLDSRVTVDGTNSIWTMSGELVIGNAGTARVEVKNGGLLESSSSRIGATNPGNNTDVVVTGSRWTNSGNLLIGDSGRARLFVSNGGVVENTAGTVQIGSKAGSRGDVDVSGPGSRWTMSSGLEVGSTGVGTLTITNGGLVESPGNSSLGRLSSASSAGGTVTVTGPNSRWNIVGGSAGLSIGANELSEMTITDGGEVRVDGPNDVIVDSFSSVTVSGAGSKWINDTFFAVRAGSVSVTDGAELRSRSGALGETSGFTDSGTVTVDGANSQWIIEFGLLSVGGSGPGTLNIGPGALVRNVVFDLHVTPSPTSTGTVNLDGGELDVRDVFFGDTAVFNFNAGTLRLHAANNSLNDPLLDEVLGQSHSITALHHLAVTNIATLQTSLVVDGGTFSAGQLVNPTLLHLNRGTFNLTNQAVAIESGGALGSSLDLPADLTINVTLGITNRGLVTGDGRVGGPFANDTTGELRAGPGQSLTLTGPATNSGTMTLFDGLLEFTQNLTNNASGLITGRGSLIASGGLTNNGQIRLSGGAGDYFGDLTNTSGSKVIITGNATGTFFDDVTNNAGSEFRVSTGATAVFLASVSGSAAFTGGGVKIFEGGPPSSVAAIASEIGDTIVSPSVSLTAGHVREDELEVYGLLTIPQNGTPTGASRVNELLVSGGGAKLDLKDNKLIVADGDLGSWNGSSYSGITGMIASDKIVSSVAEEMLTGLAVATAGAVNKSIFGGISVAGDDVLVMYTYRGDANLSGFVDADDYFQIDSNYNKPASTLGWFKGDFDYDGDIDGDDFFIIDQGFSGQDAAFGSAEVPAGVTAVPEPAGIALIGIGFATMCRRQRRG